jgi:hypothetical protein
MALAPPRRIPADLHTAYAKTLIEPPARFAYQHRAASPRRVLKIKGQTNVTGQTPLAGGRERPSGKPTFKTSPNRRRLYARAVVWTVWLSAGAVFLPRLLF